MVARAVPRRWSSWVRILMRASTLRTSACSCLISGGVGVHGSGCMARQKPGDEAGINFIVFGPHKLALGKTFDPCRIDDAHGVPASYIYMASSSP